MKTIISPEEYGKWEAGRRVKEDSFKWGEIFFGFWLVLIIAYVWLNMFKDLLVWLFA